MISFLTVKAIFPEYAIFFLSVKMKERTDWVRKRRGGKPKKWVRERFSQKGSKTCVLARDVVAKGGDACMSSRRRVWRRVNTDSVDREQISDKIRRKWPWTEIIDIKTNDDRIDAV